MTNYKLLESVLLVDDDEIANRLHEDLINELGLTRQVLVKSNGKEAIDFLKDLYKKNAQLPSLILADLCMPVMDGFDFLKTVRSSKLLGVKNIPIAVLTVHEQEVHRNRINDLGSYPFIPKPLDQFKFFEILHSTVIPQLSPEHLKVILERQKYLEDKKAYLIRQNTILKDTLASIRQRRIELEEKLSKMKGK